MIRVQEVIITDLSRRGSGKDELSPVRSVLEVYTKEGDLIAFHDGQGNYSFEEVLAFGKLCRENVDKPINELLKKAKH